MVGLLFAIIFALIAVAFALIFDLRFRVKDLEYGYDILAIGIKEVDNRVTDLAQTVDKHTWAPWNNDGWAKTFDGYLVATLDRMGISREKFIAGCFIEGTPIQIDRYGNIKNIEQFRTGDYVYVPSLDGKFPVIPIYGNETGFMYQFVTNDSLSITVTKTHRY